MHRNTNKMSLRDVNSIDIVKRFDFDSALARMSVIVSDQQSTRRLENLMQRFTGETVGHLHKRFTS